MRPEILKMILFFVWILFGGAAGYISIKRQNGCMGLIGALWFGPLALLYMLTIPPYRVKCNACFKWIDVASIKCPYCQTERMPEYRKSRIGLFIVGLCFFGIVAILIGSLFK